jgi:NitT/TauT family transport system substrate-binding protein
MSRFIQRSTFIAVLASMAMALPARAADKVTIAYIGGTADVGFYIADAKGYLRDEGIEANFIVFDSDVRMIAPLSTGEVDIGSGMINAGTYNAVERGITLRAVADKARNKGTYSYQALVVRKALWDSGAVRSIKDLKGRKFGLTGQAGNSYVVLAEGLRKAGLALGDVEIALMSLPQQSVAFASGAIDASFLPEPFLSAALKSGSAVSMLPVTQLRDDDVTGVITYGEIFMKNRPDVARKMTKAYIRGLRVYSDALKDGRLAGPGAAEVIDIISRYSKVKDKTLLAHVIPHFVDPNGELGIDSLKKDWAFYKEQGLIKGDVTVDQIVDRRWVADAVKELGPYRPRQQ